MRGKWIWRSIRWLLVSQFVAMAILGLGLAWIIEVPQTYGITDLGTLGGAASEAYGINNAGQVVGWSTTADGAVHGFLYDGGVMTDLGTLDGGSFSHATGINDQGQVVGYGGINAYGPMFREFTQGFIWQNGGMQPLGALYCPCSFNQRYGTSAAYGINSAGQAVGDSETVRGETIRHAFLWQDGAMQDIGGGAGGWSISYAYAINLQGQVVGRFDDRAFLWQDGARQDLGTLPGHAFSAARAINIQGRVVGESVASTGTDGSAFRWEAGVMCDLGVLPGDPYSQANGINALGQIVGRSGTRDGVSSRAFVWQDDVMRDLNSLVPAGTGWELRSASAINNPGQIVGSGILNGQPRAFLLSPGGSLQVPGGSLFSAPGRSRPVRLL